MTKSKLIKFPVFILYLVIGFLLTVINAVISVSLCGTPDSTACPLLNYTSIFGLLIFIEGTIIGYLTGKKALAFLGSSPFLFYTLILLWFGNFLGYGELLFLADYNNNFLKEQLALNCISILAAFLGSYFSKRNNK